MDLRKILEIASKKNIDLNYLPKTFEAQIYWQIIQDGDVIFDVGANIGTTARIFSRLAGIQGKVFCFEPNISAFKRLQKNIVTIPAGKASVIAFPFGLAEVDKQAPIHVPRQGMAYGSMAPADEWQETLASTSLETVPSEFYSIDSLISKKELPLPDMIKIDVEGAEKFVLQGAIQMLARSKPVLFLEVFAPWQRAFDYGPWDVLGMISELGYKCYFACPDGLDLHMPSKPHPFPEGFLHGYNLLALHPDFHENRSQSIQGLIKGNNGIILPTPPAPYLNK